MKQRFLLGASLALCTLSACAAHRSATLSDHSEQAVLSDANIAKVKAGSSTRADVKAVIGSPWRIVNYGEVYCGCPHRDLQEVWEYRGTDSAGAYTLHIEFDDGGISRTVAKVQGPNKSFTILASSKPDDAHDAEHLAHHQHTESTQ